VIDVKPPVHGPQADNAGQSHCALAVLATAKTTTSTATARDAIAPKKVITLLIKNT
jgi:hypothetical protein